ncbi:hypothetical protein BKA69DRAFT_1170344 [Paraphysoderma sedebokerense]|nr:hypothetical protein BKA69DRAFT_1170344 [Paraphysoderma sedebokerense]
MFRVLFFFLYKLSATRKWINDTSMTCISGFPSLFIFWLPLIGASILRKELLQELYHARKVSGEISKDDIVLAAPKLDVISAVRGSLLSMLQKSVNTLPIRGEVLFSHHLGSANAPAISYPSP